MNEVIAILIDAIAFALKVRASRTSFILIFIYAGRHHIK
ncbi:hypothetical protein GBP346_A3088 [Burkholderia pseudomallei MSHR346]|nr:hypothetical protein GBP346_A3088 [Burkholderia pseudomallei MSHR346]